MAPPGKVSRNEALAMLGLHPKSHAQLIRWEHEGVLTRHVEDRVAGKKRRRVFYDVTEIETLARNREEARAERARETHSLASLSPKVQEIPDYAAEARLKARLAYESFDRETLTQTQAETILGVDSFKFARLVDTGLIRARRFRGDERFEREDVIAMFDRLNKSQKKAAP